MVHKFEGHFDEVSCMAVRGTMLYTGSLDCTIRKWSIASMYKIYYYDISKICCINILF